MMPMRAFCAEWVHAFTSCFAPPRHVATAALPQGSMVIVRGLRSAPQHNGREGKVLSFEPYTGRYIVVLDPAGVEPTLSVRPDNLLQSIHIEVFGLESRSELNGVRCRVSISGPLGSCLSLSHYPAALLTQRS